MKTNDKHIIIFDGVCTLCEYSVQFIIKNDPNGRFTFAAAQSQVGEELQKEHGFDTIKDGTVILIKNTKVYVKSDAALEIARELKGLWRALYVLRVLPKSFRDYLYSLVSRYRYQWFGKKNECFLPDQNIKDRFL